MKTYKHIILALSFFGALSCSVDEMQLAPSEVDGELKPIVIAGRINQEYVLMISLPVHPVIFNTQPL